MACVSYGFNLRVEEVTCNATVWLRLHSCWQIYHTGKCRNKICYLYDVGLQQPKRFPGSEWIPLVAACDWIVACPHGNRHGR